MYNFNDAESQQDYSDLIPNKTIAKMILTIRPGKHGPEGILTLSKSSPAVYLDCEFTVSSGRHNKRKFWQNIMVDGVSEKALAISRSTLRAILESARNIQPGDTSELAVKGRCIQGFSDMNGLEFVGKIGIDKAAADSTFSDKNKLTVAITPDMAEYKVVMNGGEIDGKVEAKAVIPETAKQASAPPAWATQGSAQPSAPAAPVDSTPAWAR